jgi:hypothetical protein
MTMMLKEGTGSANDMLSKPLRRKKISTQPTHFKDRCNNTKFIQEALDIASADPLPRNQEQPMFFGDTCFFDHTFPVTEASSSDPKKHEMKNTRTNQKEAPEALDIFCIRSVPQGDWPFFTNRDDAFVANTKREGRRTSTSPKGDARKEELVDERSTTSKISSPQHRRSRSKQTSVRKLDKQSHKTEEKKRSSSHTRSNSRGRSSSKHRTVERDVSKSRERKARTKSRDPVPVPIDKECSTRRMLRKTAPTSRSSSADRLVRRRSSSKEERQLQKSRSRSSIQNSMRMVFAEGNEPAHAKNNVSSPPSDHANDSSPLDQKRLELDRRRAELMASKTQVDEPPIQPVRSPEKKSPSTRSRTLRSNTVTKRRAISKRNLLDDARSNHTTTTATTALSSTTASRNDQEDISPSVNNKTPHQPQTRRQLSLPVCGSRSSHHHQASVSNHSNKTSDGPVAVSAATGELSRTNTPSRPQPGMTRSLGTPGGIGRQADPRIDGLLQKLRDPSSRNLLVSEMRASTFGAHNVEGGHDLIMMKKPGMLGRFAMKSSIAGVRLDE